MDQIAQLLVDGDELDYILQKISGLLVHGPWLDGVTKRSDAPPRSHCFNTHITDALE